MKDPMIDLQTAYYIALNGNLSDSQGNNAPVYDSVPEDASYPYVRFGTYTVLDTLDKDNYSTEVTQELQIVTGFPKGTGGKKDSHTIANDITAIVVKRDVPFDLSPAFNVSTSRLDNSNNIEELTSTHHLYRRILRFRHLIEQLT